jgi:hypothetical protein
MEPIVITAIPRGQGKFIAKSGDLQLCHRTVTPFLAAARTLLANGTDPATPIIMRHMGSDTDCLTSTVGAAAKLSPQNQAIRFRPFEPFDRNNIGSIRGRGEPRLVKNEKG